jgi:hypothetical protein
MVSISPANSVAEQVGRPIGESFSLQRCRSGSEEQEPAQV